MSQSAVTGGGTDLPNLDEYIDALERGDTAAQERFITETMAKLPARLKEDVERAIARLEEEAANKKPE